MIIDNPLSLPNTESALQVGLGLLLDRDRNNITRICKIAPGHAASLSGKIQVPSNVDNDLSAFAKILMMLVQICQSLPLFGSAPATTWRAYAKSRPASQPASLTKTQVLSNVETDLLTSAGIMIILVRTCQLLPLFGSVPART